MKNVDQAKTETDNLVNLTKVIEESQIRLGYITNAVEAKDKYAPCYGINFRQIISGEPINRDNARLEQFLNQFMCNHWEEFTDFVAKQNNIALVKQTKLTKRAMLNSLGFIDDEDESVQGGGQS